MICLSPSILPLCHVLAKCSGVLPAPAPWALRAEHAASVAVSRPWVTDSFRDVILASTNNDRTAVTAKHALGCRGVCWLQPEAPSSRASWDGVTLCVCAPLLRGDQVLAGSVTPNRSGRGLPARGGGRWKRLSQVSRDSLGWACRPGTSRRGGGGRRQRGAGVEVCSPVGSWSRRHIQPFLRCAALPGSAPRCVPALTLLPAAPSAPERLGPPTCKW